MDIDSRNPKVSQCFVGKEVEHSSHLGKLTLFVAGYTRTSRIVDLALEAEVQQIYLAANQSYSTQPLQVWMEQAWELNTDILLPSNTVITLDVPYAEWDKLREYALMLRKHPNIHIMLSVCAPGLNDFENLTVKLDDRIPHVTNPGVWCISKSQLQAGFTPWAAYTKDSLL